MSFPSSPVNNQQATVNNIIYTYDSTKTAWLRLSTTGATLIANTLALTSGNASVSTTSGALIVTGGAGIGGNLHVGGLLDVTSIQDTPIGSTTPNSGSFTSLSSTLTLVSGGNIVAAASTASTSSVTGALVVKGGSGISGDMYVGGMVDVTGQLRADATTASTSTTVGALVVAGGVGIAGNIVVGESIISATTSGFGSVGSRFTVNTAVKADFHVTSTINGSSATNTQQYGITFAPNGSSTQAAILIAENGADGTAIGFATTNNYATGPVVRAIIDPTGHFVPAANATYDLGNSTTRWRNVYTNDLQLSNGIGDYTIVEGEDDLFLYNNRTGKTFKFLIQEVDPTTVPPKAPQD